MLSGKSIWYFVVGEDRELLLMANMGWPSGQAPTFPAFPTDFSH